eukprot:gene28585-31755_t
MQIRKKNEALNYMKLASRLDAVVSRLDTQAKMGSVTKNLSCIVKSLEKSMDGNNLEKITETMGQFERQFENLDLQTSVVDNVMSQQANLATPEDEVVKRRAGEDRPGDKACNACSRKTGVKAAAPVKDESDDLAARLADLRGR